MLAVAAAWAQPVFITDFASFQAGENLSLLQVYALIQRNTMEFEAEAEGYCANFALTVEIKREDSVLTSISRIHSDRISQLDEISPGHKIPQEVSFHITPGIYTVAVYIDDKRAGKTACRESEVSVKEFPQGKLSVSDLEFASKIQSAGEAGIFVKNKVLIIPNAERIYGDDAMTAYYYAEIYNLSTGEEGQQHQVSRTILDENMSLFKQLPPRTVPASYTSLVEANLFSCATIPTGTYHLKITVRDGVTGDSAVAQGRFWVYKKDSPPAVSTPITSGSLREEIDKLTLELAGAELEFIRYITDKSEKKMVKKLEPEGYKNFLLAFWRDKDISGEMRRDFLQRVNDANQRYSSLLQEGWMTDRGRALIIYGKPDLVERRDFGVDEPDAQIWHYDHLEGGIVFVFVDMNATGDLKQVYSTKLGEFVDATWVKRMETSYWGILQEIRSRR